MSSRSINPTYIFDIVPVCKEKGVTSILGEKFFNVSAWFARIGWLFTSK